MSNAPRLTTPTAVLALFGLAVGIGAAEIAARTAPNQGFVIPHPIFNHIWAPDSTIVHSEYENQGVPTYERKTNSLGWLTAQELNEIPGPNERRIFFMGDSFTEGTVPEPQTLPALVERQREQRAADSEIIAITVNTGTLSYSPLLHLLRYRDEIRRFHPTVLFVNVDMTDVFDDYLYRSAAQTTPDGTVVAVPSDSTFSREFDRIPFGVRRKGATERFLSRAGSFLKIAELLRVRIFKLPLHGSVPEETLPHLYDWCQKTPPPGTDLLVAQTMKTLTELVRLAKADGVQVYVTAVPHLEQFTGEWSLSPFESVSAAARAGGAIYIDSFTVMKQQLGSEEPQQFFYRNDMHFNARGYEAWSKAFIPYSHVTTPTNVSTHQN